MLYRIFALCSAALFLCCGCSETQPHDPPAARAELTVRLLETLKNKRYTEALAINDKLLALDPNDAELMEMRDRLIGNIATENVQKFVDAGKLAEALKYLHNERKLYPVMPRLRMLEEDVQNLIALRKAADRLAAAKTISELATALDTIMPSAARYLSFIRDEDSPPEPAQLIPMIPEREATVGLSILFISDTSIK